MVAVARCLLDVTGSIAGSVSGVVNGIALISNNGPYTLFPPPPPEVFTPPAPLKLKEGYYPDDVSAATDPVVYPSPSSVKKSKKEADLNTAIDDLYLVGWGGGGASFKRRDSKRRDSKKL
ncbi:hypothetical protein BSKO_00452 [Bryopsis sp. KO-2023]|nr:hypothetical protein BSKO_00452 [Bryopsis sp. KO-2023]